MLAMIIAAGAAAQAPAPDCGAKMLDYASWRETPGQIWDYRWPADGAAKLTLIGAAHSREPDHEQFARIAAAFAEARPSLVFFEGPDRGTAATPEETIRTRGESGYLRFLAAAADVPVRSLELAPPQQLRLLLREFPADRVLLFFTLREAARLRDREGLAGAALDGAMSALLGRVQALGQAADLTMPFSDLAGLEAAGARYWPDRDWRSLPADWFSPAADDALTGGVFLGAINRADSRNRDRHMVKLLSEAVVAGERPFALVGRNHVPMQAPALACTLGAGPGG